MAWMQRIRGLVRRERLDGELNEEMQFHLQMREELNVEQGMRRDEAKRDARVRFGNLSRWRESMREIDLVLTPQNLWKDLRFGLRMLWHNPGFTAAAVLTLGLAIGANTAIFSLLDQALVRALPVQAPKELVVLSFAGAQHGHLHSDGGNTPGHTHEFTYPMYKDLRDGNTVLSGLIASAERTAGVTWNNRAEAAGAEIVSGNYFETLGVRPAAGRLFDANDETSEGANALAVMNFDYWRTHLGGADVVGKTLLVNGTPFTVVGVAAPGFHSVVWGRLPDIYVPITMQHTLDPEWYYLNDHQSYWINVVGRLRPGVTRSQAEASLNGLFLSLRKAEFTQLKDQSEKARKEFIGAAHLNLDAGARGFSPMRDDVRTPFLIIMGMAVLIIGMAIVNVASLLLVRAAARVREFSVRFALGATSGQILRQLFAEGALLGVAGAGLGLLLAPRALDMLIRWMSGKSADETVFTSTLDWRLLAFTMLLTVAASLLFSLAPAVQFWNPRLAEALKVQKGGSASGSLKFRRTCVGLQIGFSLLLIIAAGLFVRTIQNLRNADPGFATERLLQFDLAPEMAGYAPTAVAPAEERILERIAALPGIRGVGATNDPDLADDNRTGDVVVSGYTPKPDEQFDVELPWVSDGYLQTLGVPLMAGRYFNAGDTATAMHVAIVNESFAKHFFGSDGEALGHHVSRPGRPATDAVIVGVVRDVKHSSVRDPATAMEYVPFVQAEKPCALRFYVRTWQSTDAVAGSIRAAIAEIDAKLVMRNVQTMTDEIDENILAERTIALLATTFGVLATLLAGIGLYGILAYSTAQRTREIGIRMALGARRWALVGLIVREVMMLAGGAMAVTIPLALVLTRLVRSQLFGVSVGDPLAYGIGVAVVCVVAALAGFIPARRAASVDPTQALRAE